MKERIVYTNQDGSCCVVIPTGEVPIDEVMKKDIPIDATKVRQITIAELPQDRLFRNAWDDSNLEDFIGLNLDKAKVIAHDMRRGDRETQLTPLDREEGFVTTTETRKTEIITEKQTILDVNAAMQTDIDGVSDETALRAVMGAAGLPNAV